MFFSSDFGWFFLTFEIKMILERTNYIVNGEGKTELFQSFIHGVNNFKSFEKKSPSGI